LNYNYFELSGILLFVLINYFFLILVGNDSGWSDDYNWRCL